MAADGDLKALWMVALLVLSFAASYLESLLLSMIASSTPDVSSMENVLESSAALSLQSQRVVLNKIGEMSLADAQCSVFGGKDSCVNVPNDTPFGRLALPLTRQWAVPFIMKLWLQSTETPHEKLEEGYTGCGECLMALQNFWCAQTIPAGGSFDHVVDELLPVVAQKELQHLQHLRNLFREYFKQQVLHFLAEGCVTPSRTHVAVATLIRLER